MARRNAPLSPEAGGETAAALVPSAPTLPSLREAAAGCRACPLWERGTQTVFGEGPAPADVLLVGEQPGDLEDRAGRGLDPPPARRGVQAGRDLPPHRGSCGGGAPALRLPDEASRQAEISRLTEDLAVAARLLA